MGTWFVNCRVVRPGCSARNATQKSTVKLGAAGLCLGILQKTEVNDAVVVAFTVLLRGYRLALSTPDSTEPVGQVSV